ncbi:hypothetical protein SAMN05216359_10440 [Roseateles sp. YR242]|uniref:hypothetical protein n=1 Tax=Roseateles sp. YR242 TaxID=1855305 RepID=UPI0008B2D674|nr:hypothetical protein [Roseateles sp. YR242]SEK93665.1 hypothetical protein SAMN05216359_10440 [Roseateles sp. YR242]
MSTLPLLPPPSFEGIHEVVAEPLKFKAKLAIGEDAYASLRMINRTREVWDVLGAAGAGAAVAKSGMVASVLGASATPLGWVAFAALASGGACYGLYRLLGNTKGERVIEIPKYLNTPLDTLGLALFDLIAPLSLRLAAIDGAIETEERRFLINHLVKDWGLGRPFVEQAVQAVELRIGDASLDVIAAEGAEFLRMNPDCNHQAIVDDLAVFLRSMLEAAGPLSLQETQALDATVMLLRTTPPGDLAKAWTQAMALAGGAAGQVRTAVSGAATWTQDRLPDADTLKAGAGEAATQAWMTARKAAAWTQDRLPSAEAVRTSAGEAAQQTLEAARKATEWAQAQLPDPDQVKLTGTLAMEQASRAAKDAARVAADKASALLQRPAAVAERLLRKRPPTDV